MLTAWLTAGCAGGADPRVLTPLFDIPCADWRWGLTVPAQAEPGQIGTWIDPVVLATDYRQHRAAMPDGRCGVRLDHFFQGALNIAKPLENGEQDWDAAPGRPVQATILMHFRRGRVEYAPAAQRIRRMFNTLGDALPDLIEINVEDFMLPDQMGPWAGMVRDILTMDECRQWMPPAVQALNADVILECWKYGSEGHRQRALWASYCIDLVQRSIRDTIIASGIYKPGGPQVLIQTACVDPRWTMTDGNGWEQLQRETMRGTCNWQLYGPPKTGPEAWESDGDLDFRWRALLKHIDHIRNNTSGARGVRFIGHISTDVLRRTDVPTTFYMIEQLLGHIARTPQPGNPNGAQHVLLFNNAAAGTPEQIEAHKAVEARIESIVRKHMTAAPVAESTLTPIAQDQLRIRTGTFTSTYAGFSASVRG